MKTPRTVDIAITGRCNLRCAYCSHFSGAGDRNTDLPTEEWINFFEELKACAVMDVILQGGEPFHRDDLRELLQSLVDNRMRFSILTNGTLISSDLARYISQTNRCDGVQVSIDGSIPITHDAFRGKGNFFKAIEGIEHLKEENVPTTVRVTIHKKNVHELESVAKLLLEDIGLENFSTNAAGYMGLCRSNSEQVQLSVEERSLAMRTLEQLTQKYNGRITATAGPLAEADLWSQMIDACNNNQTEESNGGCLTACNGPFDTLAVRSDGVMVPCSQLNHIELGRINKDDLQSVWLNHPELRRLRTRHVISLESFDFCKGCEYMNHCTGNCPALAYTLVGEENHPSPDACLKRFLEQGGELPE
jgi:SynChlorMet cassette radical SAM/SPASM protein ScmE